jgi:hypothetical protein
MTPNQHPNPPDDHSKLKSVFSLRGLFLVLSVVCVWGAAANYAFSKNTPEETATVLIPLVVISGVGLFIALAQLPLYFLAAYWIRKRK